MDDKIDLLPCPFCGNTKLSTTSQKWNDLTRWWFIKCKECRTNMSGLKLEAVKNRWNNRWLPEDIYTIKIPKEVIEEWNESIEE